jgi:hypothetical protein
VESELSREVRCQKIYSILLKERLYDGDEVKILQKQQNHRIISCTALEKVKHLSDQLQCGKIFLSSGLIHISKTR